MKIISRKEARALGLKRYFTGKPCAHGHVAERTIGSRSCCECTKAHRNKTEIREAAKQYRQLNKEKRARITRLWRARNPDRMRDYWASKRKLRLEYRKEYVAKNREISRIYARDRGRKIQDLLAVLRKEIPDLLKEFGL